MGFPSLSTVQLQPRCEATMSGTRVMEFEATRIRVSYLLLGQRQGNTVLITITNHIAKTIDTT